MALLAASAGGGLSITRVAKALRAREFSCVEFVTDTLSRIAASQPTINAFISVDAASFSG